MNNAKVQRTRVAFISFQEGKLYVRDSHPCIVEVVFFQRSESPRNISGSSKNWDLCCMLNHFSAKLPKIDDWKARAQYMYRDWRPGKSQTCRRLCVRLGDSLHRAESPLHVWGKGHPVQKATPVPQERPNLGTNSLKFQVGERAPKVH